jgi:hypothetical protein
MTGDPSMGEDPGPRALVIEEAGEFDALAFARLLETRVTPAPILSHALQVDFAPLPPDHWLVDLSLFRQAAEARGPTWMDIRDVFNGWPDPDR